MITFTFDDRNYAIQTQQTNDPCTGGCKYLPESMSRVTHTVISVTNEHGQADVEYLNYAKVWFNGRPVHAVACDNAAVLSYVDELKISDITLQYVIRDQLVDQQEAIDSFMFRVQHPKYGEIIIAASAWSAPSGDCTRPCLIGESGGDAPIQFQYEGAYTPEGILIEDENLNHELEEWIKTPLGDIGIHDFNCMDPKEVAPVARQHEAYREEGKINKGRQKYLHDHGIEEARELAGTKPDPQYDD